jgi:PAS domain-containing protein
LATQWTIYLLTNTPSSNGFAEMLPSGLAILDHKAQAVFVNQHFYELTTHTREDKSFSSWPQSIHADDYDRVMGAYQEAFSSQKQLRTEFRAQGASRPWRLLLLTPLGDENLEHVSVHDYGRFVCSIVDISCEKSAELAQKKAVEEATERREQQERFIDMVREQYLADYMWSFRTDFVG